MTDTPLTEEDWRELDSQFAANGYVTLGKRRWPAIRAAAHQGEPFDNGGMGSGDFLSHDKPPEPVAPKSYVIAEMSVIRGDSFATGCILPPEGSGAAGKPEPFPEPIAPPGDEDGRPKSPSPATGELEYLFAFHDPMDLSNADWALIKTRFRSLAAEVKTAERLCDSRRDQIEEWMELYEKATEEPTRYKYELEARLCFAANTKLRRAREGIEHSIAANELILSQLHGGSDLDEERVASALNAALDEARNILEEIKE